MADWVLVACLKTLMAEFNRIAPGRSHASDGSIGDKAHEEEVSDHNPDETGSVPIHDADHINEVHAIDVDVDLREPGLTMETVVQFVLARCRSGKENRLRYIIYNRRIWEADNEWRQRAYTGASAHTEHAHFSCSYDTVKEASTASWHLEEIPVTLDPEDIDKIAQAVWGYMLDRPESTTTPKAQTSAGGYQRYNDAVGKQTAKDVLSVVTPVLEDLQKQVDDLRADQVAEFGYAGQRDEALKEQIAALAPKE
jgi:hypothetical protein